MRHRVRQIFYKKCLATRASGVRHRFFTLAARGHKIEWKYVCLWLNPRGRHSPPPGLVFIKLALFRIVFDLQCFYCIGFTLAFVCVARCSCCAYAVSACVLLHCFTWLYHGVCCFDCFCFALVGCVSVCVAMLHFDFNLFALHCIVWLCLAQHNVCVSCCIVLHDAVIDWFTVLCLLCFGVSQQCKINQVSKPKTAHGEKCNKQCKTNQTLDSEPMNNSDMQSKAAQNTDMQSKAQSHNVKQCKAMEFNLISHAK